MISFQSEQSFIRDCWAIAAREPEKESWYCKILGFIPPVIEIYLIRFNPDAWPSNCLKRVYLFNYVATLGVFQIWLIGLIIVYQIPVPTLEPHATRRRIWPQLGTWFPTRSALFDLSMDHLLALWSKWQAIELRLLINNPCSGKCYDDLLIQRIFNSNYREKDISKVIKIITWERILYLLIGNRFFCR